MNSPTVNAAECSAKMTEFEDRIRAMTVPRQGVYPRPWTTDAHPEQADVLIVGASSAKTFRAADVGSHDRFLDALWNRNGQTCRGMYSAATTKPSRTRPKLDRLSAMLAEHGLTSLQTNVTCSSAPYDADVSDQDRVHGTELFKVVVEHVSWKTMIVHGVGASRRLGRALGVTMPLVPSPESEPVLTTIHGRAVFISPTLAPPAYRHSVWRYLEKVVSSIAKGHDLTVLSAERRERPSTERAANEPNSQKQTELPVLPKSTMDIEMTDAKNLVHRRMQRIEAVSGLKHVESTQQTSLFDESRFFGTKRLFRHKFKGSIPDILLRKDVFDFDRDLVNAVGWEENKKNKVFWRIRTDDPTLLGRILDAVEAFAVARAP